MLFVTEAEVMDTFLTKLHLKGIGEATQNISVVAAYEDFSTRARVNEFCRGLARDLGRDCELLKQAWLINLLRLPQLRTIAAQDAAASDIIIISLHDAEALPEDIKSWIDLWLQENGRQPKVLVGLFDVAYRDEKPAMQSCLDAVARQANMEFFAQSWEMS
jgi:hypothetical protein